MWIDKYLKEADKDISKLDQETREMVFAGITKVLKNPLPNTEGGYGKPLGNKGGRNLTGFFKIKFKDISIRVVYTLVRDAHVMNIVVVSIRDDAYCYDIAERRKKKHSEDIFKDKYSKRLL